MKALAVVIAAALAVAAGCGGRSAKLESASPAVAKTLMTTRLKANQLDYRWVACVRVGRKYTDVPITRCNVNFGDPHIQAYCSVLRGDRLVTQYDDAAIPCGHDDAGWRAPVKTLN